MTTSFPPWRRPTGSRKSLCNMMHQFCWRLQLDPDELKSPSRVQGLAKARQAFMLEAYETGRFSTFTIGELLGRDHSTVVYGIAQARRRREQARA